jgi:hypothetical protein
MSNASKIVKFRLFDFERVGENYAKFNILAMKKIDDDHVLCGSIMGYI